MKQPISPATGLPATDEEALSIHLHGINNIARNAQRGVSEEQRAYIVHASAMALEILSRIKEAK